MWVLSKAAQICSSLYWLKGSKFDLEGEAENKRNFNSPMNGKPAVWPFIQIGDSHLASH